MGPLPVLKKHSHLHHVPLLLGLNVGFRSATKVLYTLSVPVWTKQIPGVPPVSLLLETILRELEPHVPAHVQEREAQGQLEVVLQAPASQVNVGTPVCAAKQVNQSVPPTPALAVLQQPQPLQPLQPQQPHQVAAPAV